MFTFFREIPNKKFFFPKKNNEIFRFDSSKHFDILDFNCGGKTIVTYSAHLKNAREITDNHR